MEIAFKVFDELVSFAKSKKKNDKVYFETFVEPLMNQMNIVHQNYLTTFANYIEIVKQSDKPLDEKHPVFFQIKKDSILSSDFRDRVYSFYDANDDRKLQEFLNRISQYFRFCESVGTETVFNMARKAVSLKMLTAIKTAEDRKDKKKISQIIDDEARPEFFKPLKDLPLGNNSPRRELAMSIFQQFQLAQTFRIIGQEVTKTSSKDDHTIEDLTNIIEEQIQWLMKNYRKILDSYNSLKKELLK